MNAIQSKLNVATKTYGRQRNNQINAMLNNNPRRGFRAYTNNNNRATTMEGGGHDMETKIANLMKRKANSAATKSLANKEMEVAKEDRKKAIAAGNMTKKNELNKTIDKRRDTSTKMASVMRDIDIEIEKLKNKLRQIKTATGIY